ncbi:MAG: hypothetical protein SF052_08580 [Bacteroidia bacterium]|nr:hypothetical protein [Bacteroidia bacterium]
MEEQVLWEAGNVRLTFREKPGPQVIELLDGIVWGTPGGIRYRKSPFAEKPEELTEAKFLKLYRRDRLIATLGLMYRKIVFQNQTVHTYYFRNFAFIEPLRVLLEAQSAGSPKRKKTSASLLHQRFLALFEKGGFFESRHPGEPVLFFAYVINNNARSARLIREFGFEEIRMFRTLLYSNFFPRIKEGVSLLPPERVGEMTQKLAAQYADSWQLDPAKVVNPENYYVIISEGEILAGVSARPTRWELVSLPGFSGKMITEVLPRLPFIRKGFQPDNFRFAALEGLYVRPGAENRLPELFASTCARLGLNIAMIWLDEQSREFEMVNEWVNLGLIHRLSRNTDAVTVVGRSLNMPEEVAKKIYETAAYISAQEVV